MQKGITVAVLMIAAPAEQIFLAGGAVFCAVIASVYDVRQRRIPNRLTVGALACGLLVHFWVGGWNSFGASILAALIAGGLFLVFFLAGGMGAGDVKLMAAIASITGLASIQTVMLLVVLAGGLFALVLATYHGRVRQTCLNMVALLLHQGRSGLSPHPVLNISNTSTLRLPFGLPIAAGCIAWLCLLASRHVA